MRDLGYGLVGAKSNSIGMLRDRASPTGTTVRVSPEGIRLALKSPCWRSVRIQDQYCQAHVRLDAAMSSGSTLRL
jgi:hypothetical protein